MNKNVTVKVNGEVLSFPNTQKVALNQAGSEQVAVYNEITDTTATASDVRTGKKFYDKNGYLTTGTYDGGGGGDPNGWPIVAEYAEEMTEALINSNRGRVYDWEPADPTALYPWVAGALYIVRIDSSEVY